MYILLLIFILFYFYNNLNESFTNSSILNITFNEKYQMFYLKKAVNEYIKTNKDKILSLKIDHKYAINYINNIKIPLTFPIYIKKYISKLNKDKIYDYNFIGKITNKREWVNKFKNKNSIIKESLNGRNKKIKYSIDKKYYDILSKSKFTLTPTGDCNWSYRFFEAIMCLSIPILENNSKDIFMKDYFFYYEKDNHIYSKDKAHQNYNKFINSEHFLKNIKYLKL
jgi:hypothetical protein